MSPSSNSLAYILLFLTVLNLILNYLYRHQLFTLGLQFIQQFQQSEHYIITFLLLIPTILIDPVFVLVVTFTLVVMIKTKERTFMTVMFILLNAFLSCLLKTFYADPRPFWVNQQIKTIGIYCPLQYGNPSGHSWFAVTVAFGVIIEYWGVGKNNRWVYTSIALIILVPLSRMYLGAHSLNQVLQGLYLGFIMVILYQFSFLKQSIESYLYKFNSFPKWKHLTYCLHILYLVGYAINSPAFNPNAKPVPQDYIDNIALQCPKQFNPVYLNFRMLLVNSYLVNFATGIAVGFGQVNLAAKGRLYLSGQWLINDQRYKPCVGYLYFFAIEVGWLVAGVLPSAVIIYIFNFNELVIFIFGNIGVYLAGYLYTSRSFKTLFAKEVIRQEIV